MENEKVLDIFELGKDTFNFHYNNLKNTKKFLKNYITIIDSFIESINSHKNALKTVYKDLKQNSTTDIPFKFLKKIEILINIHYNYNRTFLKTITTILDDLKKSINIMMNNISEYLSYSQNLSINIKNTSKDFYPKYDKLIQSLEETELVIIKEYTKEKYNISLNKLKIKDKDKDKCIKDSSVLEREFLNAQSDIKEKVNNYINEYNENLKKIKQKMALLNDETKNGVLNIIKTMKNNYNNFISTLYNESEIINNIDNNDTFKKEYGEYLNYTIKKDNDCELLQKINLDKYILKITKEEEKNLIENDNTKFKNNKLSKVFAFTNEDVYNIVKTIYNYNFEMINKDLYNLETEEDKLKIIELMGRLLDYNFDTHSSKEEQKLTEAEKKNFINLIFSKEEYFTKFLLCLNNYRASGKYKMDQELFDTIKYIFDKEADSLLINFNKKIASHLIILSQTFYILKGSDKHFLQKEIKKKELFRSVEFWIDHFEYHIEEELQKFEEESKKNSLVYTEKRKKKKIEDIMFSKIASLVASLNGFELEKEKVDTILLPIMDKYNLSEETKNSILSIVKIKQ